MKAFLWFFLAFSLHRGATSSLPFMFSDPKANQTIKIVPFGRDSLRIFVSPNGQFRDDLPGALLPTPIGPQSPIRCIRDTSTANGNLQADILPDGRLSFKRIDTGAILFEETALRQFEPVKNSTGLYSLTASFSMSSDERLYGLGQHKTGVLNNVGQKFQMNQVNTEVFIPLVHSSRDYSYLWNLPSFGSVDVGDNETTWVSDACAQMDFWVTTEPAASLRDLVSAYGDCLPSELDIDDVDSIYSAPNNSWTERMRNYVDVTGRPTVYPFFASGFWQSRNRYRNQSEFLDIAYGYASRDIPVSILVIDYFSWDTIGNEVLDPKCWPDPKTMTKEVLDLGMKIMVSPYFQYVKNTSTNYEDAFKAKVLVTESNGQPHDVCFTGKGSYMYDVFSEKGRTMMMDNVLEHYYFEDGIQVWWLDCPEPCARSCSGNSAPFFYNDGMYPENQVGSMFPNMLIQATYDAMVSVNLSHEAVMLSRSAWAGAQRYGGAVWSGDIPSTFDSLARQIRAGLNIAMSGIYYWTTDIGGYHGGDLTDPEFEELIVRWFQFGAFCPLFRLHGCRSKPSIPGNDCGGTCAPNELWAYSNASQMGMEKMIYLRESLRDYVYEQYRLAATTGVPIMRPLFFDFPDDSNAMLIEDEFMFGPDWLVAPITVYKATSRSVYLPVLPNSDQWRHHFTGTMYKGGQNYTIAGPLDEFPLFQRTEIMPFTKMPAVQKHSDDRKDHVLCVSSSCFGANTAYVTDWTEGYAVSGDAASIFKIQPLLLYYSDDHQDNCITNATSPPDDSYKIKFENSFVFVNQENGTIPLWLFFNHDRMDHLTVASQEGIDYAQKNGYQKMGVQGFIFKAI